MKITELLEATNSENTDNTFMGTVKNKMTGVEFDVYAAAPANRVGERSSDLIYLVDKKTGRRAHKFASSKEIERYYDWVKFPGKFSEELDSDEYNDEAGMAQNNLHTMARAVNGLLKTIKNKDNLPEWTQEKIAKAEQMLVTVWDYILSQKEQGHDPKIAEAATAGATSSANIATVINPGMTNKNPAAGKPGKMAKKGPPQWMPKKQTPQDNALNKNVGLMTGTPIRR